MPETRGHIENGRNGGNPRSGTKPNSKTDHRREGLTSTEKRERENSRPHTGTLGTEDPLGPAGIGP